MYHSELGRLVIGIHGGYREAAMANVTKRHRWLELLFVVLAVGIVLSATSSTTAAGQGSGESGRTAYGDTILAAPGRDQPGTAPWAAFSALDLPPSDGTVATAEGWLYPDLQHCSGLTKKAITEHGQWREFESPRNALLYLAAAYICDNDVEGARPYYDRAREHYGDRGLVEQTNACAVYRSVASVLEQKPAITFACPGGPAPKHPGFGTDHIDNPLTFDIDESQVSAPKSGGNGDKPRSAPGFPGGEGTAQAIGAPLQIPGRSQDQGKPLDEMQALITNALLQQCDGQEPCVTIVVRKETSDIAGDKCVFDRTEPQQGSFVKRGSTVTIVAQCPPGNGTKQGQINPDTGENKPEQGSGDQTQPGQGADGQTQPGTGTDGQTQPGTGTDGQTQPGGTGGQPPPGTGGETQPKQGTGDETQPQ
jgi:hypothetical protein